MKFVLLITLVFLFNTPILAKEGGETLMVDELQNYKVKKHDTLMIIAFNIYGDYRKWKDLLELNPEVDYRNGELKGIEYIKYRPPKKAFIWQPLGEPYLIQKGDTLGTISKKFYNTTRRWREIYNNNRPLIRYPNLIFSGFTIYYVPDPIKNKLN